MAGGRKNVLDVREMVRRMQLQCGDRQIAREMKLSRNTVSKYRHWAGKQGFLESGGLPGPGVIEERMVSSWTPSVSGPVSIVESHRDFVLEKRKAGVEIKALWGLLRERGFEGSYPAVRRFIRRLEPRTPPVFLRIETPPGEEAQVDFGYVGEFYDPVGKRQRKSWVFVMTLGFSRHQYVEIVFDQRVETWVALHVRAFESFGGVVKRVVIDNLKAGIVKAVVHDAEAQRSYRELAEAYGFLISPCRPRTPRHKGKVESGVHYVKRNALAGRSFKDVNEANAHLEKWVKEVAGVRDHGTTHEMPLSRFEAEKAALSPLPQGRYEVTVWKKAKLHPDCHVVFEYAYYSAPYRLVGEELWLRAAPGRLEIYHDHQRVATHPRAARRGAWATARDHLPPEKLAGLLPAPVELKVRAEKVGPATLELVERLLGERPLDRLRSAQGIVGLSRRFGDKRLEAACRRALAYDEVRYGTVKRILDNGLDAETMAELPAGPLPRTSVFARSTAELVPMAN